MKIREVIILPQVKDDLAEIIEFVTFSSSRTKVADQQPKMEHHFPQN